MAFACHPEPDEADTHRRKEVRGGERDWLMAAGAAQRRSRTKDARQTGGKSIANYLLIMSAI